MFVDYYAVLEIEETATIEQIKAAFKQQAIKWHPDKNPNQDTNEKMQLINEAYLILKDQEARKRYDIEYQKFKSFKSFNKGKAQDKTEPSSKKPEENYKYKDYTFDDEVLSKWMRNAKRQAVDLAKRTVEDFKGMSTAGAKGAAKGCFNQFLAQIVIGIVFLIIFTVSRGCS